MKKLLSIIFSIVLLTNIIAVYITPVSAADRSASFIVNTEYLTGKKVGNVVGYMNTWGYDNLRNIQSDGMTDTSFVDYIEIMTATGGSEDRDLIDANGNLLMTKLNALAEACQGILNLGAKPLIKLGCIPFYFSTKANPEKKTGGSFGYNVFPPDDGRYEEYQQYLENVIQYMIDRFGIDEVRTWRYGVMTEYENDEWFYVLNSRGKIDTNATKEAFFKIYDYSVQALENKLGAENVFVGAHSMTVTEGIWDEREFIAHAANGYNYAKGKNCGAQIDYLSFSFYDSTPERYTSGMTLAQCVNFLRDYAVSQGLTDLKYGIDEGRILSGVNHGQGGDSLNTRCVGHMWQAGYDARMFKTMLDNDIDYFCFWSMTSDSIGRGYPTISYHVANSVSKMVGDDLLTTVRTSSSSDDVEVEAFSSYDKDNSTLKILAYNYKNSLQYSDTVKADFDVSMYQLAGQSVKVKYYPIDSNANYFDEWWSDREKYGITDDKFNWSPDDPTIDSWTTLSDPQMRDFYYKNLRDKYIECSKLTPHQYITKLDSIGYTQIYAPIGPNNVVYYEISPADELDIAVTNAENLNKQDYVDFSKVESLLEKVENCLDSDRIALANQINEAISLLVKNTRTGSAISTNTNETNYPYAYLQCNLKVSNADIASSGTYATNNDIGSTTYFLDGNDTYDFNNFHVWNRTYQNTSGPTATFYVDRYSYSNLSQLGNIISADFTTWGRNHQHSIGIADTNAKMIDGSNKTVSVVSNKGKPYSYSLVAENGLYSAGSESSFVHTPDSELIKSSKSASVNGAVPQAGEQVTVRIGARISDIDGYGWGNLLNYYCWTDVKFIGYDTTQLRQLVSQDIGSADSYIKTSFDKYMNAYRNAVSVLNNSYSQSEIDSALTELSNAINNLVKSESVLKGDVNLDGSVDGMDAVVVKCIVAGLLDENNLSETQLFAADIDKNEIIDINDSQIIEQMGIFI